MTSFTPREIVSELDRYIVSQGDAKRAQRQLASVGQSWNDGKVTHQYECVKKICHFTSRQEMLYARLGLPVMRYPYRYIDCCPVPERTPCPRC